MVDAVDFIAALRQANKGTIDIGRRVVVIGGGMTAVDAAVQAKLLGAEEVTICYRRGKEHMNASRIRAGSRRLQGRHPAPLAGAEEDHRPRRPRRRHEVEYTELSEGRLVGTGETGVIATDQVFKAIGQTFEASGLGHLAMEGGRIVVDADGRTSMPGVWAGGDCVVGGEDLTMPPSPTGAMPPSRSTARCWPARSRHCRRLKGTRPWLTSATIS